MRRATIVWGLVTLILVGCEQPPTDPADAAATEGAAIAKTAVKGEIDLPSTARFLHKTIKSREIEPIDGHRTWHVHGTVEYRSRSGGQRDAPWEAVVCYDGEQWFAKCVDLHRRTIMGDASYSQYTMSASVPEAPQGETVPVSRTEPARRVVAAPLPTPPAPPLPTPPDPEEMRAIAEARKAQAARDEKVAAGKVRLAQTYDRKGLSGKAEELLQEVVADYGHTEAADEARGLLER